MAVETARKIQIIVYVEFALLALGLIGIIVLGGFRDSILDRLVDGAEYYEQEDMRNNYRKNINQAIIFTASTLILDLVMIALLFVGFRRDDDTKLDAWLIVHGLVLILMGFGVVYALKSTPSALSPKNNVQTLLYIAYRIWSLVVVNQYIKQLREIPPPTTEAAESDPQPKA